MTGQDDFREQIEYLEAQAAQQRPVVTAEKPPRSRASKLVAVGAVLIALELILLTFQSRRHEDARSRVPPADPLMRREDCRGVAYRTYLEIVAHLKEHGAPPPSLESLVGTRLEKVPVDPATGRPLVYSTDGQGFDLRCPGSPRG